MPLAAHRVTGVLSATAPGTREKLDTGDRGPLLSNRAVDNPVSGGWTRSAGG
jgi:hypothetical protein